MPHQRIRERRAVRRALSALVTMTVFVALTACSSGSGTNPSTTPTIPGGTVTEYPTTTPSMTPSESRSQTPSGTPTSTPTSTPSGDPLAGWTLEQKVGQLFMVGVDVSKPLAVSYTAVRDLHVGNIFLAGRTQAGVAPVHTLVDSFTKLVSPDTTHNTPLFVATDQEGGAVQVMRGPGFSVIPSAMVQATRTPAVLQSDAATWGAQLAAAGVNLNLAPVMDYVPSAAAAAQNPPIGYYHRNYGYTPDSVTSHANAFSAGMESAGVDVAIKHFPSLGLVHANTDTTAGVTDNIITPNSHSVAIFASGIEAGAAFVMTSTAVYTQIDPSAPGAFSPVMVDGLLRQQLGFDGVVITDDVSAAKQVQAWSPADRAILTIEAGGDMVLASADPSVVAAMVAAVVGRAQADSAFADQVDAAARRWLAAKENLGG